MAKPSALDMATGADLFYVHGTKMALSDHIPVTYEVVEFASTPRAKILTWNMMNQCSCYEDKYNNILYNNPYNLVEDNDNYGVRIGQQIDLLVKKLSDFCSVSDIFCH